MNNSVKAALIFGAALVAAVAIYTYSSPYQSCVREMRAGGSPFPATLCAKQVNSN